MSGSQVVDLPPDFVRFIATNYDRVAAVQQKVKEFEQKEQLKLRLLRRGKFKDGYSSFDSCFSDKDVTELISAKVVPKVKLEESFESVEVDASDFQRWLNPDFDSCKEEFEELTKKFPLISFDLDEHTSESMDARKVEHLNGSPIPPPMIVTGMQISRAPRKVTFRPSNSLRLNKAKHASRKHTSSAKHRKRKQIRSKKPGRGNNGASAFPANSSNSNTNESQAANSRLSRLGESANPNSDKRTKVNSNENNPRLTSATLTELTTELYKRYYSNSELQLTLPPLHSSVLTLLGQRPNSKTSRPSSQSQGTLYDSLDSEAAIGLRQKQKLRRHGRKGKGDKDLDSNEDSGESYNEENFGPSVLTSVTGSQDGGGSRRRSKVIDDPHDTQMSVMSQRDDIEDLPKDDDRSTLGSVYNDSSLDLNARRFQMYVEESAKSLHQVLDEQLMGTEWNSSDLHDIEAKISLTKEELHEYEAKFKAGNIRMKEDMWLALPRTWSRSSATFGIPTDTRMLKAMGPLEYIEKYVFISEPRKLLYSLVFHRYRTMENPTGKTISYHNVSRAVSEVLGRPMLQEESASLEEKLLHIQDRDMEITETLFRGICAVAERIFGQYCLEDSSECFACLKYTRKDKNRCHKNKKNQLEKVDLEYVAAKIKDGKVKPELVDLLQSVFDRD